MKHPKKILPVDDDATTHYITEKVLRQSGAEVDLLKAWHGREALDIVREVCQNEECPELILLDIKMPVMDGFGFLEQLQKAADLSTTTIRIVLLSSSTHYLDMAKAKEYPVIGFVEKPLTLEKLSRFL